MSQLIMDLFFASIFILLLILLFKIRERAFTENRQSFQYVFYGIFGLGLVSIIQIAGHQNLFDTVPFLSEPIYRELIQTTGIVAGVAMLIAGASMWLPGKRTGQRNKTGQNELKVLIASIERALIHYRNVRRILPRAGSLLCRYLGFESYAIFKVRHRTNNLVCTDSYNLGEDETESLAGLSLKNEKISEKFTEIKKRYNFQYDLSFGIENSIKGAIFIKGSRTVYDNDRICSALDSIGQTISMKLTSEYTSLKETFYRDYWHYSRKLNNITARRKNLRSAMAEFYGVFKNAFGAEYLSLAIAYKTQKNIRRFTVGLNGNILMDGDDTPAINSSHLKHILKEKKNLLINNINSTCENVDILFAGCGQSSLLAVPVIREGDIIAVLTLGHTVPGHFKRRDLYLAEMLSYSLIPSVEPELSRRLIFERDKYLAAINTFDSLCGNTIELDTVLNEAAGLLIRNLKTTMVRISLLNRLRTEAETKAVMTLRPLRDFNSDRIILSGELTPWHNIVMNEARLLLINQDDPESRMSRSEMESAVFPGMRSALIVPVVVNGFVFGFITLGEMRGWDRYVYDAAAINFCKSIASKIAETFRTEKLMRLIVRAPRAEDIKSAEKDRLSELRRRIKLPVTNLRGSLDLLKLSGIKYDDKSKKVLSGLEESAEQLTSLLNDE